MHLQHLTINGFKSFAKKSDLEFSAPITAIVGPNGSGKSNVAESFRFVLGEQSAKGMRAKRGADLIFNGSESISRGNRASVQITLDNRSRVFGMDFDQIVIDRTVHRDGQNEYEINGSKVRLKDVQELLAAANIGPTGHHIISQGEADRILSASTKERREMVEDALGLKVFQIKKGEAEKKLAKTTENIEKVESLRREVAPHLKYLERQIKKIERSIQLRNELNAVYAEYLKREDTYIAHHYDRLQLERQAPQTALEDCHDRLKQARTVLAESQDDQQESSELLAVQDLISAVRTRRQELLRTSGQLEGQVSFLERRIADAQKQAASENDAPIPVGVVKQMVDEIEKATEKAVKADDVSLLRRALTDVTHLAKRLFADARGQVTIDTSKEEQELKTIAADLAKTEEQLSVLAEDEAKHTATYENIKTKIEAESAESREAERTVFKIVGEQRELENQIATIDQQIATLERDRDEFKRELQEAVALLGSAAANYFKQEIVVDGVAIATDSIVSEDRNQQRERRRELEKMKIRLEELGGNNDDVEKEYKEVKERDAFLEREIADLTESVATLEALIAELTEQLNEQFVAGIDKIAVEFNRFFTLMFGGGEAKLLRVKPTIKQKKKAEDEFGEEIEISEEVEDESAQEGIELQVKLPNKKVSGLDMLSGGERALTSIALIFAMSQVNPPLFIILDETDAALDEANSRRYGDMIEALAEKSQLILITHNRETMSRAGILYGVTMGGDGVSKLLSVKFDEAAAVAK